MHRESLSRGAGRGKLVFVDAFSGIAGDMTIAAFVDLGVPFSVVNAAIAALGISGFRLELRRAQVGALGATKFDVAIDAGQPERRYDQIVSLLAASSLEPPVRALAEKIFRRLAEAEAQVHRVPVESVGFHEVGAVDSIVDIVGAAACIEYLGATLVSSPLPMGRGSVHCQHGILPLPAPATVACLRGVPTYDAGIDAELVTPTGAAIIGGVVERFCKWPSFSPLRIGWGAGTKVFPNRLNALRLVLGDEVRGDQAQPTSTHVVLEANIDDMTGELTAHVISTLLDSGALDAWATPIVMKKGRPGIVLSVLCESAAAERISEVMLRESSTIGVRKVPVSRTERPRHIVDVTTPYGVIPVKVSEGPYGPPQVKPEFEACTRAAREARVPVREVLAAALTSFGAKPPR